MERETGDGDSVGRRVSAIEADARRAAERAARRSYGRLIAVLAAKTADIAAAEDALSESFVKALATWPVTGVPQNPDAWLLTVARNQLIDGARRAGGRERLALHLLDRVVPDEATDMSGETIQIPDERLQILLMCAHPEIAPADRTALMLQSVLGLSAKQIAGLFLVPPAALSQRLVRAKARIREMGIRLAAPAAAELPDRAMSVLDAVYAAFTAAHDGEMSGGVAGDIDEDTVAPADELIALVRLLAEDQRLPRRCEAEALGLLALMLFCGARRGAWGDVYTPLDEQDVTRWSRRMIEDASMHLTRASEIVAGDAGGIGRYQLEGAIQSAHSVRVDGRAVEWAVVVQLYDGLLAIAPSIGAMVGRAVALGKLAGPAEALRALGGIDHPGLVSYQPFHAAMAHHLMLDGQKTGAREAYVMAIGLTQDARARRFLQEQLASL